MPPPELDTACPSRQQLEQYARGIAPSSWAEGCESHLNQCAGCQRVLCELFESGKQPEWLATICSAPNDFDQDHPPPLGAIAKSHGDSASHWSERSAVDSPESTLVTAAHRLWQQQAVAAAQSEAQPAFARPNNLPGDGGFPTESTPASTPESIGRYRIRRLIGQGGFGQVYLAYDEKLKRNVALKVPHRSVMPVHVPRDLMLDEAQTVAALDHPAIVPIFDVASTEEIPLFLVSKLIVGQSLAERLALGPLEPMTAAALVERLADALWYAHKQGVIHRDIKPQNILVDESGEVYLCDFGLAWRDAEDDRRYPMAGTPFYMSPEQRVGRSELIDQRSDIYSLGRVLQQMLTAREEDTRPNTGTHFQPTTSTPVSSLSQQSAPPASDPTNGPQIGHYPTGMSAELIAICAKATAHEPQARYQDANQLCEALRAWIHTQNSGGSARKLGRRAIATLIILCALAIGTTLLGRTAWRQSSSAEQAVKRLMQADLAALGEQAQASELSQPQAVSLLRQVLSSGDVEQRRRAQLGLLPVAPSLVPVVADDMLRANGELALAMIPALLPHASQLSSSLWQQLESHESQLVRLNAAAYLAAAHSDDLRWADATLIDRLLQDLAQQSTVDLQVRLPNLRYIRQPLVIGLKRLLSDAHLADRQMVAQWLPEPAGQQATLYALWEAIVEDDLSGLIELLFHCPASMFTRLVERLRVDAVPATALLRAHVTARLTSEMTILELKQRHVAALALLHLGQGDDYWLLWRGESDPRHITVQLNSCDVGLPHPRQLVERLRASQGVLPVDHLPPNFIAQIFIRGLSERRNLLLALSATGLGTESLKDDAQWLGEVCRLYKMDADPAVHVLAAQILQRAAQALPELDVSAGQVNTNRHWYHNSLGQTMVIVQSNPSVAYRYSIASCETQRAHFARFLNETGHSWTDSAGPLELAGEEGRRAQGDLSWYDCAAFCNWLSRREGLEECYLPNADGKYASGMSIKANALSLSGYRVPTAGEWETAARAAAYASTYFGDVPSAREHYIWEAANTGGLVQVVGQLRPNSLGLFDTLGNVSEWTMSMDNDNVASDGLQLRPIDDQQQFYHLGGGIDESDATALSFAHMRHISVNRREPAIGLRVSRSMPESQSDAQPP